VAIYSGRELKQYSVRKQDMDDDALVACDGATEAARLTAAAMGDVGKVPEKR
jgi:pilus assembly protein CpaB